MLVTVTFNLAIDKTAYIDRLKPYALNRLANVRTDIGGKGVNVSRVVAALGGKSIACGFVAGETGATMLAQLEKQGIRCDFVELPGSTRTNLKLVEPDGALTELNECGPTATETDIEALAQKLETYATPDTVFVLAGSVGPGVPCDVYAKLTARLRSKGSRVLLDADGPLLARALEAELPPHAMKPNLHELAEYFAIPEQDVSVETIAQYVPQLQEKGVETICVSLGGEGAVYFGKDGTWAAPALPVKVSSTVGAGDTMVAALAYGMDQGLPEAECFRLAVAASAGACTTEGTQPPSKTVVEKLLMQVKLESLI